MKTKADMTIEKTIDVPKGTTMKRPKLEVTTVTFTNKGSKASVTVRGKVSGTVTVNKENVPCAQPFAFTKPVEDLESDVLSGVMKVIQELSEKEEMK